MEEFRIPDDIREKFHNYDDYMN